LRRNGVERVALEDPGWHAHRLILEDAGLAVAPVPVDAEGIDVAALAASNVDAVVVTPAHQFPSGAVLSARRRAALVEWAERGDRLVIEDDYDAELGRERVGALQGLAPDRVLYVGSASKRLAPGMRLGWMLAPSWLSWALISAKAIEDGGSEITGQLALADFIAAGELERHLRRMRVRYGHRRETLLGVLSRALPDWQPSPAAGGLHQLVLLPGGTDEPALLAAAARHGVGVEGLSLHSYTGDCPPGVVLGHAYLAEPAIERGVQLLAAAVRATQGER
jgi:GntR family transcriptional regulator/MocR family aminotransferase